MARENLRACILVVVALFVMAGNFCSVAGGRQVPVSSLPTAAEGSGDNFTDTTPIISGRSFEIHDSPVPSVGSWKVFSNMPDTVSVHCHSQLTDLGASTITPQTAISQGFPIILHYNELWVCDFKWSSSGGPLEQSFEVWAHDGLTSFLWRCWDCEWKVQRDGFYFKNDDGQFYLQWTWNPWNGQQ